MSEDARQLELFLFGSSPSIDLPHGPALHAGSTLQDALPLFAEHMRDRELAENTRRAFLSDISLLADYAGSATPLSDFSSVKLADFIHYLQFERGVPCSPKSLDRRVTTLRVFFGWLTRYDVLTTDPAASLAHHRPRSPLPSILAEEQIDTVLTITRSMRDAPEAPDARPHLLITLLLATGIKKSECMRVELHHIDLGDLHGPTVYIHYDKPRQRFKTRRLSLPEDWPGTLEIYLRRYQPQSRLFDCTARNLEYVLHGISTLANLRAKMTFEMLRWTCAVRGLEAGMEEERLRKRLGLSKVSWKESLPVILKLAEGPL